MEAVIALPCLVLILFAILHVAQTGHRKQRMLSEARNCVWQFARAGCQDKAALPKACLDAFEPTTDRDDGHTSAALEEAGPAGVVDRALDVPVVGDILEQLIGRNVAARFVEDRARPAFLGGGQQTLSARTVALCNTVPVRAELFDAVFDKYWTEATR